MSFGGHVLDMIHRQKLNRDLLKSTRKRNKKNILKATSSDSLRANNVTVEELNEIDRLTKEREKQQDRYFIRTTLIILGIALVVALLIWAVV